MPLHKDFPSSPHDIIDPSTRWYPTPDGLKSMGYDCLLPPLVEQLRTAVKEWRDTGYEGCSATSRALLTWWFATDHPQEDGSLFQYYFAQREAIETIIYLHEVIQFKDKYDLMRFDSSGAVSTGMFQEHWRRLVVKMATGSGKTKVMSLAIAWSFFHKTYEESSNLARNFLLIAPNIIVLDRLRGDFQGCKIFWNDPVIPHNGFEGRNWRDDFQLNIHIQDEVRSVNSPGNLFLTNIQRVYNREEQPPSADDENTERYFLGSKPTGSTTDSKINLTDIVQDLDELMVVNDEAHHIHDEKLAWFQSIRDIHNKMLQKNQFLSLQVDFTATPKHNNGSIFVQTISDYPLVEAIAQNVVKRPTLPDTASRAQLEEKPTFNFTEKYSDYINLGVVEWRKVYEEHKKMDKKAILFIMTDDTTNCDEVATYLKEKYPHDFGDHNSVLVIHTNRSGDISEAKSGKKEKELKVLRAQANKIDGLESPYRAVVSVLMLKEGWDVRNVTTIVGLRAYSAKSNILPEQTLGRGLRRMYPEKDAKERLSVIGTRAFMDFVEAIENEGVELERVPMGEGVASQSRLWIEIDRDNKNKDLEKLDIEIPRLSRRLGRNYERLSELSLEELNYETIDYQEFSQEIREITFRDVVTGEETHKTTMADDGYVDYDGVLRHFHHMIAKDLRLVSGYDVIYGLIKHFITYHLFGKEVSLDDMKTLKNLSQIPVQRSIIETFKKAINELIIQEESNATIVGTIRLSAMSPFPVKKQNFLTPQKSVFNKIVGDSSLELEFADFLEKCSDIISYGKNYSQVNFQLDYVNSSGKMTHYIPDFIIKKSEKEIYIVETKGLEELDIPLKMKRLSQWCEDVNKLAQDIKCDFIYVDQDRFEKYRPSNFSDLIKQFREYKSS